MKLRLSIVCLLAWQTLCPQALYKAAEDYFRTNPFKTEFSQFINTLVSDPGLVEKDVKKKTDSTLFFLQGIYPSYAPFFFPTKRCKIVLAEQEFADSLTGELYSYFIYQVIGYATPGEEGVKDIKQEFEKLNRRLKKGLEATDQKELRNGNELTGTIVNYRYNRMAFFPLTIAWATSPGHKENIVVLSIRFFLLENRAYLPIPTNSP